MLKETEILLCHAQLVRPSKYKTSPVTSTVKLSRVTKVGFTMEFRNAKIPVVLITVRNSSCGNVMFSQASVSHSVHWGVHRSGCAWWGGGMHGRGHVWQGGIYGRGGIYGGGHVWRAVCMAGGHMGQLACRAGACVVGWGEGACVVGETVTAADGTHPTEMHSCFLNVLPVIPISVSYFVDNSLDVSGLLEEMMQKMNQLNESLSQEKERVTKLEGL